MKATQQSGQEVFFIIIPRGRPFLAQLILQNFEAALDHRHLCEISTQVSKCKSSGDAFFLQTPAVMCEVPGLN